MKSLNYIGILVLIFTFFLLPSTSHATGEQSNPEIEVYKLIKNYHVSGKTPSRNAQGSIDSMLLELNDPYARYYSAKQVKDLLDSNQGKIAGIGVLLGGRDNQVFVDQVFDFTPAKKAGLLQGDQIIAIDNTLVQKMTLEEVTYLLRGEKDTQVSLQIKRGKLVRNYLILRQPVQIPLVEANLLTNEIGYIRITSFTDKAANQFVNELEKLKQKNVKGLILDLRGNSGGVISAVNKVVGQFVGEGTLAFIHNTHVLQEAIPIRNGKDWDISLAILVNEQTASAAEVTTGALRYYRQAIIVGTQTFGKGTVQQLFMLQDGSALKITVDEYSLPAQDKVDGIGLTPDVLIKNPSNQRLFAMEELLRMINKSTTPTSQFRTLPNNNYFYSF
ncbi:carboxyl-terminal processing protease [Ureibacillus xyleni]|uniref:Carboxyl-terminal processing protease n=1 Tax=Ureibacillus xyleni TaxID=614648 RepID=A0A285RVW2_9BACL|nr:S41 family peptidase [Ureibacillus xyleni]SOB98557.1 carboxyl-terminal processing protease [Ureibacillus xyleni]